VTDLLGADIWLFRQVNGWHAPWLDPVMLWLTHPPARPLVFALLAAGLAWAGRSRGFLAVVSAGLALAVAVALVDQIAAEILKPWADRVRPCFALADARLLLPGQARSPSFPSNHAANTFAAAMVIRAVDRRAGNIALAVAAAVAWSRIYVGVHYPLDVTAGALLGAVAGGLAGSSRNRLGSALERGARRLARFAHPSPGGNPSSSRSR